MADVLQDAIKAMQDRLNPASGLPLSRQELADKLNALGKDFDTTRASKAEAKLVKQGVDTLVQLKARTVEMATEADKLIKAAVTTYQQHFGEDDEVPAAAPAAATAPGPGTKQP